ncbi:amino acid adenylation domain-containing protein, partial [Xanthomonas sp. A2111]
KRLVGYVTADSDVSLDTINLRAALSQALPEHMLPSSIVVLGAMPITANGKIDHKLLPHAGTNALQRTYEAPSGELEIMLAEQWAQSFGLERVGRHDHYFELGGHSLTAMQLVGKLRRLGHNTDVRTLFDHPTLADFAANLTGNCNIEVPPNRISVGCTAITPNLLPLATLTQADIDLIVSRTPGGICNVQDIYALSPLQEGILFHHLLNPAKDPYRQSMQLSFDDRHRLDRYLDAMSLLVRRHDILRTTFQWEQLSEPVQVVLRQAASPQIDHIELQPGTSIDAALDPARFPIDLTRSPLLRFVVAQEPDSQRWRLLQLQHHLIGDRATVEVLLNEVTALMDDHDASLPHAQPYRNLIARARLGSSDEEHARFFRAMLADIEEPTLPFGLTDVQGDGIDLDEACLSLPIGLVTALSTIARSHGVTLASLCHLAWGLVIARASNREQVVFGSVLLGRMQSGEGALGLSINTLPMRVNVGRASVRESVRETHARLSGLIRHEHASLGLAQRCSAVPQPTPLFSSLFNYRHGTPGGEAATPRLPAGVRWLGGDERTNYPLILSMDDRGTALDLIVQVVRPHVADRIAAQMQHALECLVTALERTPNLPVCELDVLPAEERHFLLETLNDTKTSHRAALCMHQPFETLAHSCPDLPALIVGEHRLSYAELNRAANRVAHGLLALGVRPDDLVAICVERGVPMVIGLLGILKAGGAYLPLDPSQPANRLAMILEDAAPRLMLVDGAGRHATAGHPEQVLTLALDDEATFESQSDTDLDPADLGLTTRHLAYVIYTSGSTGMPKGAMNEHRALRNRLDWMQSAYGLGPGDVVLQKTSFGFDVSVWEFFWTLGQGATLVVAPPEAHKDPGALAELIFEHAVTIVHFVPSMLSSFLDFEHTGRCASLRHIVCSGEALPAATLRKARRMLPDAALHNLYGPTEAAIDVTAWTCPADFDAGVVPIGRPIANTRMYLLDERGRPVPFGVVGELYIGGSGVARGYLNRDELTAERFLSDPFSSAPEGRMYRTGDIARYLPDGNIDFIGRNDQQIKLRGFRIELSEIEAALLAIENILRCTVVLREDKPDDKRLVAYMVAATSTDPATFVARVQGELSTRLPEYMVPAAYVLLEAMPLNTNGKLDYKALPEPSGDAYPRDAYTSPQNATELAIANAWSTLLGIERVGRQDHFFRLGGHSLLAVRLIEHLRKQDIHLDVRTLFLHPTLSELAALVRERHCVTAPLNRIQIGDTLITPDKLPLIELTQADIDCIVATVPGGINNIQDIYALSSLQEGILFHHQLASEGDPYLQINRLELANRSSLDRYLAAVQRVVDRHDILRTVFVWENLSTPAQVVLRAAKLQVDEVALNSDDIPTIDALARRYDPRHYRIDLGKAPLLRFAIARQPGSERWVVLQIQHHLIDDISSLAIMLGEIRAILDDREMELPPPLPFREMVAKGRLGPTVAEQEAFFRGMLADIQEPTLPLGLADVHRDGSAMDDGERLLPARLTGSLRAEARRLGVSLASLCHVAWGLVVGRLSGRDHVVFGTVLFGRMHAGASSDRAMGLFINTLPLRLDLVGTSVVDAVLATHARLADLMRHENASLALAQRCSGLVSPAPLFSALLNYRHYDTQASAGPDPLPGVTWLSGDERSNYPFTLSVDDREDALGLNAQVAKPHSAERLCSYMQQALENLLDALIHTPAIPVQKLKVLPLPERTQLL